MKTVIDSIIPVIENSKFVHINKQAILDFSNSITEDELKNSAFQEDIFLPKEETEEHQIALAFIFNSINFCYWGEPKWTIEINGKFHDGCMAMMYAIIEAIKNGYDLCNPEYLKNLSENELKKILIGNIEIPLFKERLSLLNELGKIVLEKYNGSFSKIVEMADYNATKLTEILVKDFPNIFNDVENYNGHEIKFYKRAQLSFTHLSDLNRLGFISKNITGYEDLTAFADYKIPQSLRKFGILEYNEDLSNRVDNKIEIKNGSEEEIEIRANAVFAVELISKELINKFPQAVPANIDRICWFRGQTKSPDDKPYHRTRTIWY